jgi:hypothetical protein
MAYSCLNDGPFYYFFSLYSAGGVPLIGFRASIICNSAHVKPINQFIFHFLFVNEHCKKKKKKHEDSKSNNTNDLCGSLIGKVDEYL